ncbi:MAG TPA: ABC transporter ATP-binding protein [Thermoanaerobaculia bacterium]|nr:ABC transporter ATP-binding protein [Thermoanaerobaculia bacterium]
MTNRVTGPPVIRVAELSKRFRRTLPGDRLRTLKSALVGGLRTRDLPREETIPALEEVSFEVARGESFGLIGGNGSGKSTLLKLVAGMLRPTTGELAVDGRVAALIELGAGFHPEISGRENVYINGAVLGLARREIDRRYRDIVEFSGLADFMEEPVKNYSSGMYVRLGFAVAIHTDPDVLLVDEVLAVGDEAFAHRCIRRIEEFLAAGRTLLLVSHSLDLVAELCDRVLWLDRGEQRLLGDPRRVIDAYRQAVAEQEGAEHLAAARARQQREAATATGGQEGAGTAGTGSGGLAAGTGPGGAGPAGALAAEGTEVLRWGSRQAEITAVRLLGPDGSERYHLQTGDSAVFEVAARAAQPLADFVFGIAINTPRGFECWGTNTDLEGFVPEQLTGEVTVRVICPALRLAPGDYTVDVAIHSRDGAPYDYHRRALGFTVTAATGGVGVYFPEHRWEFTGGVSWGTGRPPAGA